MILTNYSARRQVHGSVSYSYALERNCLLAELRYAVYVSEYKRITFRDEFTGIQKKVQ